KSPPGPTIRGGEKREGGLPEATRLEAPATPSTDIKPTRDVPLGESAVAPEIRPFDEGGRSAARIMTETGLHANDDRRSVGQMLQALSAQPSSTPFVVAVFGSLIWAAVSIYGAYGSGLFENGFNVAALRQPGALLALGATIGPIVLFFILAALMRRTQ